MSNPIEVIDKRQQRYWRGFLMAFFLLMALLIVRYLFGTVYKEHELNARPIGIVVLVVSLVLLVILLSFIVKLGLLRSRAAADPQLRAALIDNELTKFHLTQSWKSAFLGAVATPFLFLFVSLFHPIHDLLLVALATAAVGSGTFLTSFYLKSYK